MGRGNWVGHRVAAAIIAGLRWLGWAASARAQEGQPYPAEPEARWETVLSGSGNVGYFGSSEEACRAQHASFNPGAIYLAPVPHPDPEQWYTVNCRWDTSPQGANTAVAGFGALTSRCNRFWAA